MVNESSGSTMALRLIVPKKVGVRTLHTLTCGCDMLEKDCEKNTQRKHTAFIVAIMGTMESPYIVTLERSLEASIKKTLEDWITDQSEFEGLGKSEVTASVKKITSWDAGPRAPTTGTSTNDFSLVSVSVLNDFKS
eukprot:5645975-Amphidinium_carterae.1